MPHYRPTVGRHFSGFFILPIFNRLFVSTLAIFFVSPAWADADDTFNVYLGVGSQYDSNLFRQFANEQSDTVQTTSLTLALSKPFAQQRFTLDATVIDYRYSNNDYLDYKAKNYSATWNWMLTHRLSGTLSSTQTEVQNSFVDYRALNPQNLRNIRKTNVNYLGGEWRVKGGWRLVAGLTNNEESNSETFNAQSSYSLNTWEAGVRYVWPAGTFLQLLQRNGSGEYKDRQLVTFDMQPAPFNPQYDTDFRQTDTEARFSIPFTGKSSLSAKLARQAREHENFTDRDYAATTGRVDYTWQPSGKLSLVASLRREVAAFQNYTSSYYLSDGFNLQPAWQISAKTALRLNYDWQRRNYEGALIAGFPERRDSLQSIRLGFDWIPVRWATLSTNLQRDTRNSSQNNFDFSTNIFSFNARLNF